MSDETVPLRYLKIDSTSHVTHEEAVVQRDLLRKTHKISKKEDPEALHRVRIFLRPSGKYDVVLKQREVLKTS